LRVPYYCVWCFAQPRGTAQQSQPVEALSRPVLQGRHAAAVLAGMIRSRTATLSALGVLGMVVILARLPGLGALGLMQYNWFGRVENFTEAIDSGRFADTYQIPHPGVTLMWIIGGVLTTARAVIGPITGGDRVWFFELAQVVWAFVLVLLLFI